MAVISTQPKSSSKNQRNICLHRNTHRIVNLQRVLQSESILARFLPAALREKKAYQNKTSFIEDLLEPQSTSAPNFLMCERQSIDDEMDPLIPIDKKLEHKLQKIKQRKSERSVHLKFWLDTCTSSSTLYPEVPKKPPRAKVSAESQQFQSNNENNINIKPHKHIVLCQSGETEVIECLLPCKFGRSEDPREEENFNKISSRLKYSLKSACQVEDARPSRHHHHRQSRKQEKEEHQQSLWTQCFGCMADENFVSDSSSSGGSSTDNSFGDSSNGGNDDNDDDENVELGGSDDGVGDSPDEDEDDDDADDFNEDFLSAEEAEDDFNSDVLDDDNNDNQGGNKEDGSERSQDQDDQDLFEEFSDSLTELRVGKKLYQSGEECSGGSDDETGGEAKSMADDDWSCFSYVE